MIVNDRPAVDKAVFVYRLKGLRHHGPAGKTLYPACTDVGQKTKSVRQRCFYTSDPVDMQRFFHNRSCRPSFPGRDHARFRPWRGADPSPSRIRTCARCGMYRFHFLQTPDTSNSHSLFSSASADASLLAVLNVNFMHIVAGPHRGGVCASLF